MMTKCKIMSVGNLALARRIQASRLVQIVMYGLCAIPPVLFITGFFFTGIMFASCAVSIPKNEEKTRTMLVDYLENNKLY